MSRPLHFRYAVPIRAGLRGRVSCGKMVEGPRTTLVWKRVTCRACRRSVAFEEAVSRWLPRNVAGHEQLQALVQIKREGYAYWAYLQRIP